MIITHFLYQIIIITYIFYIKKDIKFYLKLKLANKFII